MNLASVKNDGMGIEFVLSSIGLALAEISIPSQNPLKQTSHKKLIKSSTSIYPIDHRLILNQKQTHARRAKLLSIILV